ncbi:MAG: OmpH family outer membrane protein [Planctomycetes bacterium]|nr:OmpH family outer membrane protein [Planctomycetota bacterium]
MKSLLLAAAVGLLAVAATSSLPAGAQAPLQVGFVDLNECLRGYGKVKTDLEEFRKNLDARVGALKTRADELNKKGKELAILDRESEEFFERRRDLDAEMFKLEADEKRLKRFRAEREETVKLGAYEDIRRVVAEVAGAKGLDFVLKMDKTDPAEARSLEERSQMAGLRTVLYSRPELDITPEVTRLLNR